MAFLHLHSQDVDLLYIFYEEINFTPPFYYPTLKNWLLIHSVATIDSEEEAFKRKQVAKVIVKNSNDNDASDDDNSIMDIYWGSTMCQTPC